MTDETRAWDYTEPPQSQQSDFASGQEEAATSRIVKELLTQTASAPVVAASAAPPVAVSGPLPAVPLTAAPAANQAVALAANPAANPVAGQSDTMTSLHAQPSLATPVASAAYASAPAPAPAPVAAPAQTPAQPPAPPISYVNSAKAAVPVAPQAVTAATTPAAPATPKAATAPAAPAAAIAATAPAAATAASVRQRRPVTGPETQNRSLTGGAPVIVFDGITKTYPSQPNKPALSNISLQINTGDFIFLVGHSGSGKSTFIRLINRELVASRGRLTVAGEDVVRMRNWRVPYLRRNIGCVFQDFKLLPNKTAFENVAFALEVIGKSKHIVRTQVPEVLRLVGLEDKLDKLPDQLSGGEQQRVSVARAIVNRPPLLICDEPTGNLDPQTSLGIMRLLDRINRTGTTILVATHDREMVDSLRKRVIELENGYLIRDQDKGVYGTDA